jgi:hypothetical protein
MVNAEAEVRQSSPLTWVFFCIIFPIALFSLYLVFSRWPTRACTGVSDFAAMFVCALVGCWPIARMRAHGLLRIALSIGYLAAAATFFFVYALYFVCSVFRDCL